MSEQDINEFCQKGGKILSFVSDEKYYAFEVKDVTDIIGLLPVTRLPKTPKFIKGVINLRGSRSRDRSPPASWTARRGV